MLLETKETTWLSSLENRRRKKNGKEGVYYLHGVRVTEETLLTCKSEGEVSDPPDVRCVVRRIVPFHGSLHQLLCVSHRLFPRHLSISLRFFFPVWSLMQCWVGHVCSSLLRMVSGRLGTGIFLKEVKIIKIKTLFYLLFFLDCYFSKLYIFFI